MSQWGLSFKKINKFQYISYKCQQITESNFYKNVYYFKNIQFLKYIAMKIISLV